jgi:hypothetical protein
VSGALIVDIPLKPASLPDEDRCIYKRSTGERCERLNRGGNDMCDAHGQWDRTLSAAWGMHYPEDSISMHRLLIRVLDMVAMGKISFKQSRQVVELCKLIANNLRAYEMDMEVAQQEVRLGRRKPFY